MSAIHAVVFFIYVLANPSQPGFPKAQMQWVLYGAPTQQLAGEWAQAEFAQKHNAGGYTIEHLLVLPLGDTMYTEDGPVPAPWMTLPAPGQGDAGTPRHDTFYIVAHKNKNAAPSDKTPREERQALEKSMGDDGDFNWDENKCWYYIVYTKHQAFLVKEVNAAAAGFVYLRAAQATPAAGETATVSPWQGLTIYQEPPATAPASTH